MENASSYNAFDLLALGVLLISGIFALRRGLVREVLSLGTWILAAMFALALYPTALPLAQKYIKNEMLAQAVAGVALFCIAIIILVPLGDYISGLVKSPKLSAIDRSLGFVFGLIRGFVIMCIVFLGLTLVLPEEEKDQPDWFQRAKTKPVLVYGVDLLKSLVPEKADEKMAEALKKKGEEAKKAAKKAADDEKLEEMSTPVPAVEGYKGEDSSYDNNAREKMNDLFDDQGR